MDASVGFASKAVLAAAGLRIGDMRHQMCYDQDPFGEKVSKALKHPLNM